MSESSDLHCLFIDFNAYFASVEQQERPELRNRPVAVLQIMAETTCCIASSYEAKAFGIQTGTPVRLAKRLCPELTLLEARQDLYASYHRQILNAIGRHLPIERVLSIDEMIGRLSGAQCRESEAVALAHAIKQTLHRDIGPYVRCSIGLAPNRFLSKVASDRQKPDGLTVIHKKDLPERLYPLGLRDLPGIGEQIEKRLFAAGILNVRQLSALSKRSLHRLWGSVEGSRFYDHLRGEEPSIPSSRRYSIGHSRVLEPALRTRGGAIRVATNLAYRAAARLRQEGFWTTGLTLAVQYDEGWLWEGKGTFAEARDTPRLLAVLTDLAKELPERRPYCVAVTLHPLTHPARHQPSLFINPVDTLSGAVDALNMRFGRDTVYYGVAHSCLDLISPRISFTRIPEAAEFRRCSAPHSVRA